MKRAASNAVCLLLATGLYLYALPSATLVYFGAVLLHVAAGVLLAVLLFPLFARAWKTEAAAARIGWVLLAAGAAIGVALIFVGTPHRLRAWQLAHIVLCAAGVLPLAASWLASRRRLGAATGGRALRTAALLLVAAALAYGAWWSREVRWNRINRIANPPVAPETMEREGDGPQGLFFPSSAQVLHGGTIPSHYFLQSATCQRCHKDIYDQWNSSAHHFSSFNNQWYRKSIEYMQDVAGVKPSKWCAGCHDPALLFSGMFDRPVREIENLPEGQAGLACVMCHGIVRVKSSMGQGDYLLEYPSLDKFATSKNPAMRGLHDFLLRVNPEPHRRTFLKPFMRKQGPEFCAACHKVHLDVPVNSYRWVRGFNEYDNWQASAVSGEGARSFYYPPSPMKCPDCHMPLVPSKDDGNVNGFVHSHRFPGANTALPTANLDEAQLEVSRKFLESGSVGVDIFAVSPAGPTATGAQIPGAEFTTTFAVGEEAVGDAVLEPVAELRVTEQRVLDVHVVISHRPEDYQAELVAWELEEL